MHIELQELTHSKALGAALVFSEGPTMAVFSIFSRHTEPLEKHSCNCEVTLRGYSIRVTNTADEW